MFLRIRFPIGTFFLLPLLLSIFITIQMPNVNGQQASIIGSQYRQQQYGETIGQTGQQMFDRKCPNGMPSDGSCAGGYFCINPRETCMSGVCCPRSNDGGTVNINTNKCPDGSANDGTCSYMGICFDPKEECKSGLCCQRSSWDTGNTNKCLDGSAKDGSCSFMGICLNGEYECKSGFCCARGSEGRVTCPYGYYGFGGFCLKTGYCSGGQECILGVCCQKLRMAQLF